jgi:hypothetical protein
VVEWSRAITFQVPFNIFLILAGSILTLLSRLVISLAVLHKFFQVRKLVEVSLCKEGVQKEIRLSSCDCVELCSSKM